MTRISGNAGDAGNLSRTQETRSTKDQTTSETATTDTPVSTPAAEDARPAPPTVQSAAEARLRTTQNATAVHTQHALQARLDENLSAQAVDGPAPATPPTRDQLIDQLIETRGTATAEDAALVRDELRQLPESVLQRLVDGGTTVVTVRDSVIEARPDLKGVRPRGWPPGMTWDTVPGLYDPGANEVVIATRDVNGRRAVPASGNGHGSANLVIHETMHAYDELTGASNSAEFQAARTADQAQLSAYEQQAGAAGLEESFAESAAIYYSGGASNRTNLDAYFRDHVGAR